jgi:uncharacterized protein DUF6544
MQTAIPADVEQKLLRPAAAALFAEAELDGLPTPVRRYLRSAVAPDTPLAGTARLRMRGYIKLGRWLPFRAQQILSPHHGFWWGARVAGVISGFDSYINGHGQMKWKLLGLIRVAHADSPDHARSAAGRAAAEAIWLPTTLLPRFGVHWSANDAHHITASYRIDGTDIDLRFRLDDDARPISVVLERWGDPDQTGSWRQHPFGVQVTGYTAFQGLTIPNLGRAGWHFGTDRWDGGEFFRYEIQELRPIARHSADQT